MSVLPEEMWRRILEIGVIKPSDSSLTYKDLCCLSISSRRLHRLSDDDALWSVLLSSDFPQNKRSSSDFSSSTNSAAKTLYRIKFERERDRKLMAHRRAVYRMESRIAEHSRKLKEIQLRSAEEEEKMKAAVSELSNLHNVRRASVALNVWQPEVISGRQKQIVEQCVVPVDSRINALDMELKLCKQQIAGFDQAYKDEKRRYEAAKEQLESLKYHPLRGDNLTSSRLNESGTKRKRLKKCTTSHG